MSDQEDDREALAKIVYYWDAAEIVGSRAWDRLREGQRDVWRKVADRIIAAGFRRQAPVTDAEVEAAVEARDRFVADEEASAWDNRVAETRAALEAALNARSTQ